MNNKFKFNLEENEPFKFDYNNNELYCVYCEDVYNVYSLQNFIWDSQKN